ncbi:hypothetical protein PSA7680_00007 [Pseudoruegeria aquimaris]|uniref:Uncharacterized protein n=1 Tax=Pseudoruegeria aquimaris TaxID=393663 RepID=A0A1Y5R6C4_9RHOB|nr:hypothetical protein [Pseudoruegeria aquimaris]SLN10216.1 hypothetical protein PSA7680_00007 [Pseudoruegeria aquimaris]
MIQQVKAAYHRSSDTMLQDVAGVLALVVTLVVGLHLPSLI